MERLEIMAPAGSFAALHAALDAGADSVYFGVEQLNMRARASNNFHIEDLPEIVRLCSSKKVRTYLTVNTILYDHDLSLMKRIVNEAKKVGITAIIASDIAVLQYARSVGVSIHISTQVNISNIEAVRFYAQFADTIVLARELTLKQIQDICQSIREQNIIGPSGSLVEVEIFGHGALCVAISGKCYMSLATYNASANRGACLQNCRRSYKVTDEETGDELIIDNKYIMSPKDLCTIRFLDKIFNAGVSLLKLEGRGRSPEYVAIVTKVYKEAAQSLLDKTYTQERIAKWEEQLSSVFNRGFWHGGYYLGKTLGEWSASYGSQATKEKELIGKVRNYYKKSNIVEIGLDAGVLEQGNDLLIIGPHTGVVSCSVDSLRDDMGKNIQKGEKKMIVTFPLSSLVRRNDEVFIWKKR